MCIVIDTNAFSRVFVKEDSEHAEFEAVYAWIYDGKGKIVYGGTTYLEELGKAKQLRILTLFHKVNKTVSIPKEAVDSKVKEYETHEKYGVITAKSACNDLHLIAIIAVSGVNLICTKDEEADQFLKNPLFYDNGKIPKIYRSKQHAHLLCDDNIAECCKPSQKLNKKSRGSLNIC